MARAAQMVCWKKMNTKPKRQNLPDDELGWAENVQPIAKNDWQTVPAPATALTTVTGKTATRMFPANYGGNDYVIFFATDGSATQVNQSSGVQTTIAAAATFSANPDLTVFGSQRLLMIDATAGYCTWDGTLFVKQGGLSPNIHVTAGGGAYSSAPAVSFTGGSGSGATATAVMTGSGSTQSVVAVTLTNPGTGYKATDTITVVFTPSGATATVVVWPFISGTTLDVFAGRVWTANGRVLSFTGTAGYDDVNPANAAGSTTLLDNDLAHTITVLRNRNNYLYIFGDQSVRQIGSITVQSSVTLFTPLTLASDIGTSYGMTVQSYNRLTLFANRQGVYGIFGASVKKISDDLDGIFQLTNFSQQLSSALNDLTNIHVYCLLLQYLDPVQGARSIICVYQNDEWFVVSQGNGLLAITSVPLGANATTQFETFGSSGADVTQLLNNTAIAVSVLFKTALSYNKNLIQSKKLIRAGVAVTSQTAQNFNFIVETENTAFTYVLSAAAVINWINNAGNQVTWQNNSFAGVQFITGGFRFPYSDVDGEGKVIGGTVSGSLMTFSINQMAFEYEEEVLWGTIPG